MNFDDGTNDRESGLVSALTKAMINVLQEHGSETLSQRNVSTGRLASPTGRA
jgi:hypothetical protein